MTGLAYIKRCFRETAPMSAFVGAVLGSLVDRAKARTNLDLIENQVVVDLITSQSPQITKTVAGTLF